MLHQSILICPLHTKEKDGEGLQLHTSSHSSQSHAENLPSTTALKPGMPQAPSDTLSINKRQTLSEEGRQSSAKGIRGCAGLREG